MTIPEVLEAEVDTLVSVSGTVFRINTPWSDEEGVVSVTIIDENGYTLYIDRLTINVALGDIIDVTGTVIYRDVDNQIAEGATAEITGINYDFFNCREMTIPEAISANDGTFISLSGTVYQVNSAWSNYYSDQNVTIIDSDGNRLYIRRLGTKVEQGDIITVIGAVFSYDNGWKLLMGATAEITGYEEVVHEYIPMTIPEVIGTTSGTFVSVSGTVSEINTAWSDTYGNMCVTIQDADGNTLYVYRLATKVGLGDTITVNGPVGTYNDIKQIAWGSTAEITSYAPAEMTIPEVIASEDGTAVTVKGTVTCIHTSWNTEYGNMTVTITDADGNELYIFRLKKYVSLGDVITVIGEVGTYNGEKEIVEGAIAEITGHDDSVTMSIPEVIAAGDGSIVIVNGTVTNIGTEWSDTYGNMSVTITDEEGNELYIYRLATKVELGDNITVTGTVGTYNDQREILAGATAEIIRDEDNIDNISYIDFQTQKYAEWFEDVFINSSDSDSNKLYNEMVTDEDYRNKIEIWESVHIAIEPSYALESGMISKKDMYMLLIYDMLGGSSTYDDLANLYDSIDGDASSYMYKFVNLLGLADVDDLKNYNTADYTSQMAEAFDSIGEIYDILEHFDCLYDAVFACAQYQAFANMDEAFKNVLEAIYNDVENPDDLRNAAYECIGCYEAGVQNVLAQIVAGTIENEFKLIMFNMMDDIWENVVCAIPGGTVVFQGAKGIRALGNTLFNLDEKINAFYQMEAGVLFERAIVRILPELYSNYAQAPDQFKAQTYMRAIDMYKCVVLAGCDYSIQLLEIYLDDPLKSADQISAYSALITVIEETRSTRQADFIQFEELTLQYYLQNYS